MVDFRYKIKKSIPTLIFHTVWILLFVYYFIKADYFHNLLQDNILESLFFFVIMAIFLVKTIWTLFGEVIIKIYHEEIVITKSILWFKTSKKYNIHVIKDLRIARKQSRSYWGGNGFRLHDTDEDILILNHGEKEVEIGRGLAGFQAKNICNILNDSKKLNSNHI